MKQIKMAKKNEPLLQKIPSPMQKEGISHQIEQLSQPTNGKTLNTGKNCHVCAQMKRNTRVFYSYNCFSSNNFSFKKNILKLGIPTLRGTLLQPQYQGSSK